MLIKADRTRVLGALYTSALVLASLAVVLASVRMGYQGTVAEIQAAGYSYANEITCDTSATLIDPAGGRSYYDYGCQNNGTVPVTIGHAAVGVSEGPEFCNDAACGRADWGGPMKAEYCIAGSTQDIGCRFKIGAVPVDMPWYSDALLFVLGARAFGL